MGKDYKSRRERSRSKSDTKEKTKRHTRKHKSRSRSRSRHRRRNESKDKHKSTTSDRSKLGGTEGIQKENTVTTQEQKKEEQFNIQEPLQDEDLRLEKLFGIKDFDTTKNKSHVDTDESGVFKASKSKITYRQYMNRRGGNRASDF